MPVRWIRPGTIRAIAYEVLGKAGAAGLHVKAIAEHVSAANPEKYDTAAKAVPSIDAVRGPTARRAARLHCAGRTACVRRERWQARVQTCLCLLRTTLANDRPGQRLSRRWCAVRALGLMPRQAGRGGGAMPSATQLGAPERRRAASHVMGCRAQALSKDALGKNTFVRILAGTYARSPATVRRRARCWRACCVRRSRGRRRPRMALTARQRWRRAS